MDRRHHAEGVEHFRDAGVRGHPGRRQLAAARQHGDEEIDASLFCPAAILAEPERTRDGVDSLGVTLGFLPYVEPHERQAERGQAAEDVGQPAVGDDAVAGGVQRAVAEQERLDDLRHRLEHLRLPGEAGVDGCAAERVGAGGGRGPQQLLDMASRRVDALLQRSQHGPVGLVRRLRPGPAAPRWRRTSTARSAAARSLWRRAPARSSAPSGRRCA